MRHVGTLYTLLGVGTRSCLCLMRSKELLARQSLKGRFSARVVSTSGRGAQSGVVNAYPAFRDALTVVLDVGYYGPTQSKLSSGSISVTGVGTTSGY